MGEWIKLAINRVFSWPVAIIVVCLIFREHLTALLKECTSFIARTRNMRLKRGDTTWEATVDAASQTKNAGDDLSDSKLGAGSAISTAPPSSDDNLIRDREAALDYGKGVHSVAYRANAIKAELDRLQFQLTDTETCGMLIRQLAASQCIALFERTYRIIFGSQLQALDFLNANSPQHTTFIEGIFFVSAKSAEDAFYSDTTFEQWLSFLLSQSLVALESGTLSITVQGRDFLAWIVNAGLTHVKPH